MTDDQLIVMLSSLRTVNYVLDKIVKSTVEILDRKYTEALEKSSEDLSTIIREVKINKLDREGKL